MSKHIHRPSPLTPEERQREKELRARFQSERPTMEQLVMSGEYTHPINHGVYLEILALLSSLRRVRETSGLSLSDLEKVTGIDKAALSRLETGKQNNPTLETVFRIVNALGKRLVLEDAPSSEREPVLQSH
ncbi:MAG TPA: helix-turn-helix transcriptional regulator [Gemmataceae bacterium]|nr:helix-turn-helix transcriptional regulator [Gemmataceae bacterium]